MHIGKTHISNTNQFQSQWISPNRQQVFKYLRRHNWNHLKYKEKWTNMLPQNSASNCILLTLVQHHWLSVNHLYACGLFFHFFSFFFSCHLPYSGHSISNIPFDILQLHNNPQRPTNLFPTLPAEWCFASFFIITFCKLLHLMPKDLTLFNTNNICHPSPLSPQKGWFHSILQAKIKLNPLPLPPWCSSIKSE